MYNRFHVFFYILIFIIVTFFFSQKITFAATTTEVLNITAVVPGASGGGGSDPVPPTEVDFLGKAYPNSKVTLLKDTQFVENTTAGADSDFDFVLLGLVGGTYLFSFYTEDIYKTRSDLVTMSVKVISGAKTTVSGIFLPPTIDTDKSSVKQGDELIIFGQAAGGSEIVIEINSGTTSSSTIMTTNADIGGLYKYHFDTTPLLFGEYNLKAKAVLGAVETPYSEIIVFSIDEEEVEEPPFLMADLNDDGKVNVVDFSIAAFWYKRPLSEEFIPIEEKRLNGDGKINLIDFSMIAYYWTG